MIPPGEEHAIMAMLGGPTPLAGCVLDGARIDGGTIEATYDCHAAPSLHVTFVHASRAPHDAVATTERFAIVAGNPLPPDFVTALTASIRAHEQEIRWTISTPRTDAPASPATQRLALPPRTALMIVAAIALTLIGRKFRVARPWCAGAAFSLALVATAHACGLALVASVLHARAGIGFTVLTAFAGFVALSASLATWFGRTPAPRDRLRFAAACLVPLCIAWAAFDSASTPPRFGPLFAWASPGRFVETDPRRPRVTYSVNAHGLRGDEWSWQPPPGVRRGAVLGDSFVMGSGVEAANTLSAQLEIRLDAASTARYQVLNLGIPGDNLPDHIDEYLYVRDRIGADFFVLCLTLPNDLSDWSDQDLVRARSGLGLVPLADALLGRATISTYFGATRLARAFDANAQAVLARELSRLANDRRMHPAAPLFVFTYGNDSFPLRTALANAPGVTVVDAVPSRAEYFIAGDGHPTAAGNAAFAAAISAAALPVLARPSVSSVSRLPGTARCNERASRHRCRANAPGPSAV